MTKKIDTEAKTGGRSLGKYFLPALVIAASIRVSQYVALNNVGNVVINPKYGRIVQEYKNPNSDTTVAFIKQIHALPKPLVEKYVGQVDTLKAMCDEELAQKNVHPKIKEVCERVRKKHYEVENTEDRKDVVTVQTEIYKILDELKRENGMKIVGSEGLARDIEYNMTPKEGVKAKCPGKAMNCAFNYLDKYGAAVAFEAYNTDKVVLVGLEDKNLSDRIFRNLRLESDDMSSEEVGKGAVNTRSRIAAETMVARMKESGTKFGALIFGGAHEDIVEYLQKAGVSVVVIEPKSLPKIKRASRKFVSDFTSSRKQVLKSLDDLAKYPSE